MMTIHTQIIRTGLVAVAFAFSVAARAEEPAAAFNAEEARAAIAEMDRDQTLLARYQACPADVFRKDATLGALLLGDNADVTATHCAKHPRECYTACATKRSGEHCYRLALALQKQEKTVQPRYAQMMFQMACALGEASGCTNRASHLRNAASEGDPLTSLEPQAQETCQFRSFSVACEKDDPWGCTMLGQAYKNGEGVRKSFAAARRSYKKSCRLNPDFVACEYARSALNEIAPKTRRRRR